MDGWLHTCDHGRRDEDVFCSSPAAADIIITAGGKNFTPANLEHALQRNRWISQAVCSATAAPS